MASVSNGNAETPHQCGGAEAGPTRGMARRQAMMDAARDLFLHRGFANTSLSDILGRSKGSRSTLYEQFGNKEGLLRAIIEDASAHIWEIIDWNEAPTLVDAAALVELGCRFVRAGLAPDALAVYRIIVAESHRVPGIAHLFYDCGPRTVHARLTHWFAEAQKAGAFLQIPAEELAQVFLGAVFSDLHLCSILGMAPCYSDGDIRRHVEHAVHIFLNGILCRS